MHGWRLSDVAPAQQGTRNIKHHWSVVERCMFARCHCKHSTPAWCMSRNLSLCLSKSYIMFFFAFTGRALRDGREADLYEAAARKPLHAGPGLFKDLFVRAVCLHCLRFWMVMTSLIRFPGWDYTVTLNFLSSVILNFFHYMFTKQPPLLLWTSNSIALNYSCV